jgi:hypothetical protein
MAKYFSYFPKTYYSLDESPSLDYVTNIMAKFTFEESFKNNSVVYYEYAVSDGETPEMLAHKLYGSSEKHWIIMSMNDIMNPVTDWPLDTISFNKYINKKYEPYANTANGFTGLQWANQNIHSYYKVETITDVLTGEKTENVITIDPYTFANTTTYSAANTYTLKDGTTIEINTTRDAKTYYEYEEELNESKRIIKILKPEFVNAVEDEFKSLFK